MILSDRVTGLALAALGAATAYGGSRLPPVPGQQVGPSAFPMVVGVGLLACGLLIAARIGRSFEEAAEADLAKSEAAKGVTPPVVDRRLALRALLPPALLVFYALAVERLGFVPTAALMIFALALAFGGRLRLILPLAAVAPVIIHLVFYKGLRVPLPAGLLPMPW